MKNPIFSLLTASVLCLSLPALAGDLVPGQKEAIATIDEMLKNLEMLKKNGPACGDTVAGPSKCPGVIQQNTNQAFLTPFAAFLTQQKAALNKVNLDAATLGSVSAESLTGSTACSGAPSTLLEQEKPKKAEVDNALPEAKKIAAAIKANQDSFFRQEAKVTADADACKNEVLAKMSFSEKASKMCLLGGSTAMPRSRDEALTIVFQKDCMHPSCSDSVVKTYQNTMSTLYPKLLKSVESFRGYLADKSSKLGRSIASLDKLAKTCDSTLAAAPK